MTLSVLIPFLHDDPSDLVVDLLADAPDGVDVLVYDDGTNDVGLTRKLSAIEGLTLITASRNRGRSAARNALQAAARGDWLLFLDADMRPVHASFLQTYLDAIRTGNADIVFGGFEVSSHGPTDTELHRAMSERSDCLPLNVRQAAGPKYVASSNLCVRRDVMEAEPFDAGFTGWGWEDSEWAARVAARYRLVHIDNPALHLGLETTDTLLRRFRDSAANYARFTRAHPAMAKTLALYRVARRLRRLPGQSALRPVWNGLTRADFLPIGLRIAALKLWRASHYAEAIE